MTTSEIKTLAPIAFFHTIGHTMTVVSLGAGAVSFTHIVKAAEPFFSTTIQVRWGGGRVVGASKNE